MYRDLEKYAKYLENQKIYQKKYREEHKEERKKYDEKRRQTERYKEYQKQYRHKYRQTEKERLRKKDWRINHKEYHKNKTAKFSANKRGLGFNKVLPNIYDGTGINIDWHHIDNDKVIAMPHDLHNKYGKNHREIVNAYVEILYGTSLKELIF